MKRTIKVEIEISDKYIENWNKNHIEYYTSLYKNEEKAKKVVEENPLEKAIAIDVEHYIGNYYGEVMNCNAYVVNEK